jgi:hypothetical protein
MLRSEPVDPVLEESFQSGEPHLAGHVADPPGRSSGGVAAAPLAGVAADAGVELRGGDASGSRGPEPLAFERGNSSKFLTTARVVHRTGRQAGPVEREFAGKKGNDATNSTLHLAARKAYKNLSLRMNSVSWAMAGVARTPSASFTE